MFPKVELEVGKTYKVTNLKSGCLGFCGIGVYTEDKNTDGLLSSAKGFNMKQNDGSIWRVDGEFEEVNPIELSLDEIAEKFGVDVSLIKIKK